MLGNMRIFALFLLLPSIASAGEIFTRDGVTDGDTFYLAPLATADDDPALQSWVTFSLMRSTCKLKMGGENPAHNSSFDCEFDARRELVIAWEEHRQQDPQLRNPYLDQLADVYAAGYLGEYTAHYFGKRHWVLPDWLRDDEFTAWRRANLARHKPITRLIGSWNYHDKVAQPRKK